MRIAHFGTFDVANYGDLLLPLIFERRLGSLGEIVHVSPRGVPPVWRDSAATTSVEQALENGEFDAAVLGGGNIVHALPARAEGYLTGMDAALAYPSLWAGAAQLSSRGRIPFCWNAPGVAGALGEAAELVRWSLSLADYAAVRDRWSADSLRNSGVDPLPEVVPDTGAGVSELWSSEEIDRAREDMFASKGRGVPARSLAIHLTRRHVKDPDDRIAERLDRIAASLDATPVLLALGPCHGDHRFAAAVASRMTCDPVLVSSPQSVVEIAATIARAAIYIGSSLHGAITACSFGTPLAVVVNTDLEVTQKHRGFLDQIDAPELLHPSWEAAEHLAEHGLDRLAAAPERGMRLLDRRLGDHWERLGNALAAGDRAAAPRSKRRRRGSPGRPTGVAAVVPASIVRRNVDALLGEQRRRVEEVSGRLAAQREAGAEAESRAKETEAELRAAHERAAAAELELRRARRQRAAAEEESRRAQKREEETREELESTRGRAEAAAERFRAARARAAAAEAQAGELRSEREAARAAAAELKARAGRAIAEAAGLRAEADELRGQIRALRARGAREAARAGELRARAERLGERAEGDAAEIDSLRRRLAERSDQVAEAERRNAELAAALDERDAADADLARRSSERDTAVIRLIEAERAEARHALERGLRTRSWRLGHALARLARLAALRRTLRSSSFDSALEVLGGPSRAARALGSGGSSSGERMRIGFVEPHLGAVGGIRRILEVSNRLVARGHDVTTYLPSDQALTCDWMECRARLRHIEDGAEDELDFVIFNHEPQWYLLRRFERARYRVFLALSYSRAYEKEGSWESLRVPVDLRLANSAWTADRIAAETGARPSVVPTGVDQGLFRPVATAKRYPVLCIGDRRPWKGTDVIDRACDRLGLEAEKLAGQGLSQSELAAEYRKAEIFVVGSPIDGFGFPGLEALASGVPLVTTDNGGCREYAIHEETALIVPPDDHEAMAAAIARLRADPELCGRLVENGLRAVRERFSWDNATDGFETELRKLLQQAPEPVSGRDAPLRPPEVRPVVTIVVLSYNTLELLMRCVESIRQHTDLPYELIVVDNASTDGSSEYVAAAADRPIVNRGNAGFSGGFNQGLAAARGSHVLFLNSDTKLPAGWASRLVETIERHRAGIVFPAVTTAANPATVREAANDRVVAIPPYLEPPSGVALLMRTDVSRALGGWNEDYAVASGEDTDLCFTVWVNGLSMVLDEAVLVDHVAKASARQLPDQKARWAQNRKRFLERWTGALEDVPRLDSIGEEEFAANKRVARGVAFWMYRYFSHRDEGLRPKDAASVGLAGGDPSLEPALARESRTNGKASGASANGGGGQPLLAPLRATWRLIRPLVPATTRERYYRRHRDRYERVFPARAVERGPDDDASDRQ